MATHFHALTIQDIRQETPDAVSICFQIPDELTNVFQYREGQNVTLRAIINGEDVRRSYSICKAPYEQSITVAIKRITDGVFSTYANTQLKKGDVLDVMPPTGTFKSHINPQTSGHYLAIAAGSGITPILSIIKHTLYTNPDSRFTLIYGSKDRASILFFEELEKIKNRYVDRFTQIHVLSRERLDADILYGRINNEKLAAFGKLIHYQNLDAVYVCGPEAMIFATRDYLMGQGVPETHIHFELFASPGQRTQKQNDKENTPEETGPLSNIHINLDGRQFSFRLARDGKNILDAALQQGADLPFACKGGVCCTCRAKLIEGQVSMDVNYALEAEEVAQGFILTCQAHPLTESVTIDFDTR
ncbi:MAG: 1,2-phenylacetyl-CoA epoxidase subunit PaaE [Ferruginibacter sp.]